MMDDDNNGVLMIPAPLKKRGYIHHEGREYQIIKFLRATTNDTGEKGLIYRVRDIGANQLGDITLPYDIQSHPEEEEVEDNYFQILALNEDGKEVTLKSFATGNERKMKVRWDEDVEVIKDGLMVEDKDMFCTLGSIMGKEVIGDFKFMPKGPPIMKLPNEIMDIIFSKLSAEDRLTCRLVTKRWATLLPIAKFVKCIQLSIDPGDNESNPNPIHAVFRRLEIPNHPRMNTRIRPVFSNPETRMNDLHPIIIASLADVDKLEITSSSRIQQHLETLAQHCTKMTQFNFKDEVEGSASNWTFAKKIIATNNGHLQSLHFTTPLRELDLSSEGINISGSTSLQDLRITLSGTDSVLRNFESVPASLAVLSVEGFAFSRSQLLWITSHFLQLECLELDVRHNHSDNADDDMDADEVDEGTILEMLNAVPFPQRVSLKLGPCIEEGADFCGRAFKLRNHGLATSFGSNMPFISGPRGRRVEVLRFKRKRNAPFPRN